MTKVVTWYDVLGVTPGASVVTLRRARDERRRQLGADRLTDAPPAVLDAAARAAAEVEAAWRVLGDRERRDHYDAGLTRPRPRGRRLIVPDVRGLFWLPGQAVVVRAGLRPAVVRLTPEPLPVDGLVVGQSPGPGDLVRCSSTLTIFLWHPPRQRQE